MTVEEAVTQYVGAMTGIVMEPVQNVQAAALPAVTYQVISWPQDYSQDGAAMAWPRIQLTVSAATYADVVATVARLRAALSGVKFTASGWEYTSFVENDIDGLSPQAGQQGVYVRRMDVVVWH